MKLTRAGIGILFLFLLQSCCGDCDNRLTETYEISFYNTTDSTVRLRAYLDNGYYGSFNIDELIAPGATWMLETGEQENLPGKTDDWIELEVNGKTKRDILKYVTTDTASIFKSLRESSHTPTKRRCCPTFILEKKYTLFPSDLAEIK